MNLIARTLLAAIASTAVLAATLPDPAFAGKNTANVSVKGKGNKFRLKQKKKGNNAVGQVFGDNHNIDVEQAGKNGTVGVVAVGKGAKIKQRQTGDGELDVRVGIGFDD